MEVLAKPRSKNGIALLLAVLMLPAFGAPSFAQNSAWCPRARLR